MPHPTEFPGVTVATAANVYHGGNVVSHKVTFPDGTHKTLGVILPDQRPTPPPRGTGSLGIPQV